jgi:hypothetical protein
MTDLARVRLLCAVSPAARTLAAVLLATAAAVVLAAQTPEPQRQVDLQGKLYRSVFNSGAGALVAADLAKLREPLRSRLAKYLSRRAAFKSQYKHDADDLRAVRSDAKRRALERAMVALVDTDGIERLAAEFVAAAPIADQWEGMPERPLAEANFAENLLKKAPSSPLAPWFYVFVAHRQRVVFEACENLKNEEGMRAAAKKYRAFAERARAAADPIYGALMEDMERQPFLHIKSTNHPRDYNPDG